MSNNGFCPLTREECRRDCKWCDPVTELTEDGVMETLECAIMDIAAALMLEAGFVNDNGWLNDDR